MKKLRDFDQINLEMAESTPTKGEPSDDSFSTPLSQMKEPNGRDRDLITKAFQKKLSASGTQGSSMKTEIIEAEEEPNYVQEHAPQVTEQKELEKEEEWQMYWTEEGYLYYYNAKTGESTWAELNDPNYGTRGAPTLSAYHGDKERLTESGTDSDEVGSEYSEDSSEYDEDESDEESEESSDEYDSEDEELGFQGQRKFKFKGDMLLNAELEDDFQEYLASEQGRADMEAEQRAINKRLELRFRAKQAKEMKRAEREARARAGAVEEVSGSIKKKDKRKEGKNTGERSVLSPGKP